MAMNMRTRTSSPLCFADEHEYCANYGCECRCHFLTVIAEFPYNLPASQAAIMSVAYACWSALHRGKITEDKTLSRVMQKAVRNLGADISDDVLSALVDLVKQMSVQSAWNAADVLAILTSSD